MHEYLDKRSTTIQLVAQLKKKQKQKQKKRYNNHENRHHRGNLLNEKYPYVSFRTRPVRELKTIDDDQTRR